MDRFDIEKLERELYNLQVMEDRILKEYATLEAIKARKEAINKKLNPYLVKK